MLAEQITAVVISQVRAEGSPLIIGGIPLVMDMKSTVFSYGAPEFYLTNAAISELIRFLGVPGYGTAGCSDSKIMDEQASIECIASSYFQLLTRTNLIHDVGFLDSAMVGSFDMIVMSDEVIGMVKRFAEGMRIDDEHLAIDVIHEVGPGGHYLNEMHTLTHFKKDYWQPELICRDDHENWCDKGSTRLSDRVNEKVRSILESHKPNLIEEKKRNQIMEIIDRRHKNAA